MKLALTVPLLAVLLAFPAAAGEEAAPRAPWPQRIDEVRRAIADGHCSDVADRIAELRSERPDDPDAMVLEANCLVNSARHVDRKFNQLRHDRMLIGLGADRLPPGLMREMFDVQVRIDRKPLRRALALFRRARDAAPERADLVVGSIAVLAQVDRLGEAISLLEKREKAIAPADRAGLFGVVRDLIALHRLDDAVRLSAAMERIFPGDAEAAAARMLAALERDDLDAALRARRSVTQLPADAEGLDHRLARRLLVARRWSDAIPWLVPLAPRDPVVGAWLGIARERVSKGSGLAVWAALQSQVRERGARVPRGLPRLVEHYRRLARDDRPVTVAMHARATKFFLDRGLPIAAIAEADAAVREHPEDPLGWEALALVLRHEQLFDEALAALARAGSPEDSDLAARLERERGELLFATGRDRDAAAALDRAGRAGAPAPFARALVALARGRRDAAVAMLREAAAGDGPDAVRARARLERLAPESQPAGT